MILPLLVSSTGVMWCVFTVTCIATSALLKQPRTGGYSLVCKDSVKPWDPFPYQIPPVFIGNDETFAFRLLEGSPFYLFRKDGQINAWYKAQIIPLGFEGVIHYACCSGGYLTLKGNDTMVWFYAFKDHVWYYVEIGVHS